MYSKPNAKVAASVTKTDKYTEVRAPKDAFDDYGISDPVIVICDQGQNTSAEMPHVIAIARYQKDALQFVQDYFGISIEDQQEEMSHIDLSGNNGKYLFSYVCEDTQGCFVIYGMWGLVEVGYDIGQMVDDNFLP